jgi:hypothetical protein
VQKEHVGAGEYAWSARLTNAYAWGRAAPAGPAIEKKLTSTDVTVDATHYIKLRLHNVSQASALHRVETPEFSYMGRTWCAGRRSTRSVHVSPC